MTVHPERASKDKFADCAGFFAMPSESQELAMPKHEGGTTSDLGYWNNTSQSDLAPHTADSSPHADLTGGGNTANSTFSSTASPFAPAPQRPSPAPAAAAPNGKPSSPAPVGPERAMSPAATTINPTNGAVPAVSSKDPKAAAAAANDMRNVVRRKLTGYVGFANLPNQWHRKSVRKGFNFNVMVVGECD